MNTLSEVDKDFYGEYLQDLLSAEKTVVAMIEQYAEDEHIKTGESCIEYCVSRIKSAKSMQKKLIKKKLPITCKAAITNLTDSVGVRIICHFTDDVFVVADMLRNQAGLKIVQIKDYIFRPKASGYRSYHMITQLQTECKNCIFAEIQIRTIAQDCWASLEHQMKYKREIKNQKLIQSELKRCADEIASTDITMQTIRDLIRESDENEI